MRDNVWLATQLQFLLKKYFSDVAITNPLEIRFGREAKYRFGSIKLFPIRKKTGRGLKALFGAAKRPRKSVITITAMFAKESVPAEVVHYTIAHELCHYAHGFSSANKRLFKYPHHGGVVNKELGDRGAHQLISAFKKWLAIYRAQILSGRVSV